MASATFFDALLPLGGTDKGEKAEVVRIGFFRRLLDAMIESRRRAAEHEIDRLEMIYGFKIRDNDALSVKTKASELPFGFGASESAQG